MAIKTQEMPWKALSFRQHVGLFFNARTLCSCKKSRYRSLDSAGNSLSLDRAWLCTSMAFVSAVQAGSRNGEAGSAPLSAALLAPEGAQEEPSQVCCSSSEDMPINFA